MFYHTHNQGLHHVFLKVPWGFESECDTPDCVLVSGSRSNSRGNIDGPWSAPCQLKKPFKDLRRVEWLGRTEENSLLPNEGSLICPQGKSNILTSPSPPNISMLANSLKEGMILILIPHTPPNFLFSCCVVGKISGNILCFPVEKNGLQKSKNPKGTISITLLQWWKHFSIFWANILIQDVILSDQRLGIKRTHKLFERKEERNQVHNH